MAHVSSPELLEAAAYLSSAPSLAKVSNTTKLEVEQLYGLYKYLVVAPVPQSPRPSLFDLTGRAKWDAWSNIGKEYANHGPDAEKRYLDIAREFGWVPGTRQRVVNEPQEGEVWDEDLGVNVSVLSTHGKGGMGGSVSAMATAGDGGEAGLHASAIRGNAGEITRLLAADASIVNQRDEYGYTALHLACDRGSLPVVKVLIQRGADATLQDSDGLAGFELAQVAGHEEICTFLQTGLH